MLISYRVTDDVGARFCWCRWHVAEPAQTTPEHPVQGDIGVKWPYHGVKGP